MLIVRIAITFAVGAVATGLVVGAISGLAAFGMNTNVDKRIRIFGIAVLSILLTYLVGIIVVTALGGFSGLASLLA